MSQNVKVTVVNVTGGLSSVPIGTKLLLIKDPGNQFDPLAVNVYENGVQIGVVSSSPNTVANGCISVKVLNPMMKGGEALGIVVDKTAVANSKNNKMSALVVEVHLLEEENKQNTQESNKTFIVRGKGPISKFPSKTTLINDYTLRKNNELPIVTLKIIGEEIIVVYKDGDAGVIDTKLYQDSSPYEEAFNAISSMGGEIEGKVVGASTNAVTIEFKLEEKALNKAMEKKTLESLNDIKKKVIDAGLIAESEINKIIKYLTFYKTPQKYIKAVLESYRVLTPDEKKMVKKAKIDFVDNEDGERIKTCIGSIVKGYHMRFIGEKGGGKNVLADTLSWVFQRPQITFPTNPHADKYDLMGSKAIETETVNGVTKTYTTFQKEQLVKAMENGYFLVMDEINMLDPGVLAILHGPADYRGTLDVPSYGFVQGHKNFSIIATMNEGYQGTQELNDAFVDRLIPLYVERPESIEHILLSNVPSANKADVRIADKVYKAIAQKIESEELDSKCSTIRGYIQALELADIIGLKKALTTCVAKKVSDKEYQIDIENIIDGYL